MSARLRVGVVGVGHLGRHHARIYAEMPDVELVAVADSDPERAAAIASEYRCRALTDPAGLSDAVEAASIAVPTEFHRPVALQLLRSGIDVLVEKPLARTVEEADAIVEAARDSGRLLMTGHTERFNPAVITLARAVDRPRFFEIHRLAAFSARSTDIDVVLDLMIHDLDLLLHLDGSEAAAVEAVGINALTDKVDIANARIRMKSGCVANLTASRISPGPLRRIRVFQGRAYISCDTGTRKVERYQLRTDASGEPRIQHDQLTVPEQEPLGNELRAFVDAVRSRSTPPVDGRQGRQALELAYRVRAAMDAARALGPE